MKFVINEPKSDLSIHIEKVDHGKFARISSTSLLLNVGAFGPALKAGNPVTGSVTSLTRWGRFLRGVSTIRPSSILASRGSPARISSLRRSGPGRTTCPLVETLVCMVRRSYLSSLVSAIKLAVWVMSSRLCKKLEGAVFPFQVESLEDGVDDAVDAGHVDEADHGPGAATHFHEAALDYVGGA